MSHQRMIYFDFAVTGEHHGSIITACNYVQAAIMFKKYYKGESIMCVKKYGSAVYFYQQIGRFEQC